jgi:hypothetical protein
MGAEIEKPDIPTADIANGDVSAPGAIPKGLVRDSAPRIDIVRNNMGVLARR